MSEVRPSALVLRFLKWICPEKLLEKIEGDLVEKFERDVALLGIRKARWRFTWSAIRFFRAGIILRNRFSIRLTSGQMLNNYFKITVRNLLKQKFYSFINIFGLSIGLAVCLIIWRYVDFETSYDNFNGGAENIYRVLTDIYSNDRKMAATGHDLGPALKNGIPEIKSFVRINPHHNGRLVSYQLQKGKQLQFKESRVFSVDSNFLKVFSCETIKGDAQLALVDPSSIVMTESTSTKYFGSDDPIGKILTIDGKRDYTVTAIVKDVPENSHLAFDFLLPIQNELQSDFFRSHPRWNNFITYVEFYPIANIEYAKSKLDGFLRGYMLGESNPKPNAAISFQPLKSIHLQGTDAGLDDGEDGKQFNTIYFFILISIFILGIAWINYVNLSTARATQRAKEVGVKKAIGVTRGQLIGQFVFESIIINFLSIVLATGLSIMFLPELNDLIDKHIFFDFTNLNFWVVLFGLFVAGSFMSGAYPAFFLSSFKTVNVIKGTVGKVGNGFSLRKGLVVFQFSASLLLMAGTFAVYRQMNFIMDHDKGMTTSQMLIVDGPPIIGNDHQLVAFKNELKKLSSVEKVATSGAVPGGLFNWQVHMSRVGASEIETPPGENSSVVFADADFIDAYGMQILTGRNWHMDSRSDRRSVLVNEAAVASFGMIDPEKALMSKLEFEGDTVQVIGVLQNFHWNSLKTPCLPTILWPQQISDSHYSILLNGDFAKSIQQIEQLYKTSFPGNPFKYYFLDDFFNRQYKSDQQFGELFSIFAGLAIIIACLGLGGLASFTALQRLKEIGIRKVLGASVANIVSLLSRQFLLLLMIAGIFTLPVTWYLVNDWLNDFAIRINFSWDLYVMPFVLLTVMAISVVSLLIIKAARSNPVKVLKSE